ncbi:type II/IV secretion system protein [Motiliproteus coralliicola]|uniref:Type II/IV secretion system protein n=1 Tax=Motiliproteus coralliicola TaxID=2283196 RepID=A0A369W9G4_9GAMM|nr:GspE/PulE family protein [Motiliproteus coralliicola]RDE18307.1 type II/IV secretion system protein [Motiliproteus coralliicola]
MANLEQQLLQAASQAGLIELAELPQLKTRARRSNLPLTELICRDKRLPQTALYRALAESRNLPFYERRDIEVRPKLLNAFNAQVLLRRLFLPVERDGELLTLITDPDDRIGLETVQRTLGRPSSTAMANPLMIEAVLRAHFKQYEAGLDAISIFNDIMKEAYLLQATDLHFEAEEDGMQLRMRVDGSLQPYERPISKELAESLISRIKVLSGLDIAEQFMAQDGGFSYRIEGWPELEEIEMRVATIPTRFGERATLRILGQSTGDLSLSQLGVPQPLLEPMLEAIHKPYGIVLVTGPTGSGKSTTLYASLRELDASQRNIMTVEDPIEQVVDGISQVQVSEKVSFAKALRSFLRHDPDVMLVGEIRDGETAETAVRAAMTGHMVLSTLHTNNAVSAVSRLVDIGCPAYLIASTLVGVLAQRLLRRICRHCKESYPADARELALLELDQPTQLQRGRGCSHCLGSGYSGRVGIYETLWLDEQLEQLIHEGAGDDAMKRYAQQAGLLSTLWQDARDKVLEGTTSLQEALLIYQTR